MDIKYNFPKQAISYKRKTQKWAEQCVRYADHNSILSSSGIRKTVRHKKINYDLVSGKIHLEDMINILNPEGFKFNNKRNKPKKVEHYPIINKVIDLLLGEEIASSFDYKAVVTNPTSISDMESAKAYFIKGKLQQIVTANAQSEEEAYQALQSLQQYMNNDYQDFREMRANQLLNHFSKEQDWKQTFVEGYKDNLIVQEEIYQCSLENGIPVLNKLDPNKVYAYGMGSSNRFEDADIIAIEDYWQIGRILDVYGSSMSKKDIEFLENMYESRKDSTDRRYEEYGDPLEQFRYGDYLSNIKLTENGCEFNDGVEFSDLPQDIQGNIRVLQVYWKSIREVKKVKSYDSVTGDEIYNIYTEDYVINKDLGEEETKMYINEAWQGVMIGAGEHAIFVDCKPCPIQYNRMGNPSKCHFGIIGQIVNTNSSESYSIVDKMRNYSYMYDLIMDQLKRQISSNMGKIVVFNDAMKPDGWDFEKWIYYAKAAGVMLVDPYKEAAPGKYGGQMQVANVIDAELGNSIQQKVNILQYIEQEVANLVGITPQRLGAIQNRETVGGVERSTLQSSHTTRYYFEIHNNIKKRVVECMLELIKFSMRDNNDKYKYITSDFSRMLKDFDDDIFLEADHGIVVEAIYDTDKLEQRIDQAAQLSLQAGTMNFSTYVKITTGTSSLAERVKFIESSEQQMQQQKQQEQQLQQQLQQQQIEAQQQNLLMQYEHEDSLNQRDNETKIVVAEIGAAKSAPEDMSDNDERDFSEKQRQFNERLNLDKERLNFDKEKSEKDNNLKIQIEKMKQNSRQTTNKNNK